mmetsp:Transcript_16314/g.44713  ORF Transcript_16314/g.44713 Transcript_16314/m.44713 type:complete len:248 (-) Transcript_16314:1608-2351(-)
MVPPCCHSSPLLMLAGGGAPCSPTPPPSSPSSMATPARSQPPPVQLCPPAPPSCPPPLLIPLMPLWKASPTHLLTTPAALLGRTAGSRQTCLARAPPPCRSPFQRTFCLPPPPQPKHTLLWTCCSRTSPRAQRSCSYQTQLLPQPLPPLQTPLPRRLHPHNRTSTTPPPRPGPTTKCTKSSMRVWRGCWRGMRRRAPISITTADPMPSPCPNQVQPPQRYIPLLKGASSSAAAPRPQDQSPTSPSRP